MPFAATWIDLEIMILSEVSQTVKENYHTILLICGILKKKKKDANELKHKTEIDLQTQKTNLWLLKRKVGREE